MWKPTPVPMQQEWKPTPVSTPVPTVKSTWQPTPISAIKPSFAPSPVSNSSATLKKSQQPNPFKDTLSFLKQAARPIQDATNAVGKVIGQQSIINQPLPFTKTPAPTMLQGAEKLAEVGGSTETPLTNFLSGQAQKIPGQVKSDINESFSAPKPEEDKLTYLQRTGGAATGSFGGMEAKVMKPVSKVEDATAKYLKELALAQKAAKGKLSVLDKTKQFLGEVKTRMVNSTAPIEDALTGAEKVNKFEIKPTSDVRLQIDRVLKSTSLASQFAKDNGLAKAIQDAPNTHALDQYMIAKHAANVESLGIKTGRDAVRDAKLVTDLAPQYEAHAQEVSNYSRKLLDYAVDSGLVDSKVASDLKLKYPDYVPLERVFSEMEQSGKQVGTGKGIASLSKQTVVQKLKGSEREIASPIESLVKRTQTAFEQGERNVAGRMLASYRNLPGMGDLITEMEQKPITMKFTSKTGKPFTRTVWKTEDAPHTFSYLDNGIKKTFSTTPEIAAAAKNLDKEQLGIVMKILSFPVRVLKLGATGINLPFALTNLMKDQNVSFINTNKAASSSLLNPGNFLKALYSAVKHDALYDEVVRNAGLQTSFDIARKETDLSVKKFRSGKNFVSKLKYTATTPKEYLTAIENIVGRTEELTRIQQYKGSYDAFIKEGRTPADARLLAAKNAREATANFSRSGSFGKVLNYMIPFFNAGIRGSASFLNAAKARPSQTGAKVAVSLFLPTTVATLWNTTDPTRKKVYDDIPEFEKHNNIIIIPNNPTQDERGRWNVIKIPVSPGMASLNSIVRQGVEKTQGIDNLRATDVLADLINTGTSIDVSSPQKLLSTVEPQIVKPSLETAFNKNLYTGQDIVPFNMKDLPPELQVKEGTSPLAIAIGKVINTSPLLVENFIRTSLGGVGGQVLGEDAISQIVRRFSKATGGQLEGKEFEVIQEYKTEQAIQTQKDRELAGKVSDFLSDPGKTIEQKRQMISALKQEQNQKIYDRVKQEMQDRKAQTTNADKAIRALSVQQRAAYVINKLSTAKSREEKIALLQGYKDKEILTPDVIKEVKKQMGSK